MHTPFVRPRHVRQTRLVIAALIMCALICASGRPVFVPVAAHGFAPAAAGDLDPTFGIGGRVVTSFPGGLDTANDVAVQADGKLVVAGSSGSDFALTRYNTNGALDATFGLGGTVHTDFPVGQGGFANALVIQPDGKIVLAGSATDPGTFNSAFALVRYNTDGSLDTSFDTDGRVVTPFAGSSADASAIALQPDGKLVVAGASTDSSTFNSVFALARYNTDGSLDSAFDTDGKVTTDFPGLTFERANAVAIQADGRIVAAGLGNSAFALARYNTNGSLDSGTGSDATPADMFGTGGMVTTAFGGSFEEARALAIQADGRIIAAGQTALSVASEDNFALARYNTDGSLDNSFDTDGKVITDFGLVDSANAVVIQTDGRIVAAGSAGTIASGSFFALARYNTNGSLDNAFDTDGKVTTDFSGGRFSLGALGVALQTDGRIVAAGDANISGQRDFGVARYNTDGSLDTANFGTGGKVMTDFPLNEDAVTALLVQSDAKLVAVGRAQLQVRINGTQDPNFQLARYNSNGSLDTSFGTGGLVITDFGIHGDDFANAAALQTDGRIVVVGQVGANFSQIPSADTFFGVARYNTNGSLDTSFGTGGLVTTDFGTTHDSAQAVAIQADGRIVVAGTNGSDFILARYNTNGSLDSGAAGDSTPADSFGTGGRVTTDLGGLDSANALVIQASGKIVAGGGNGNDFALARYNTDGSLDTANFGTGGKVTTDFNGGSDAISELVSQPDGKIVAAGSAAVPGTNTDFALARYSADGVLDTSTFGTGGKVTTDFGGFDTIGGVALQADGRIVAAGLFFPLSGGSVTDPHAPAGGGAAAFFAVARYNTNGTLDTSFDTDGKVTTDFFGLNNQAAAVAIQSDGKIVAGGFTDTGSSNDFALARYQTDAPSATLTAQFTSGAFTVSENAGALSVTVTLSAPAPNPVTVDYGTSADTSFTGCDIVNTVASERCDFTTTLGTLRFAAGEQTKSFDIFITDDAYVDGPETFSLALSNPTNDLALGTPNTATVTITDNDVSANAPNPIDTALFFVQMHYVDFLNRQGEPAGVAAWVNQLNTCPPGAQTCDRVETSSRFFRSEEFMLKGNFVIRYYKVSLGTNPAYREFTRDSQRVTGQTAAEVMTNRAAFADEWVQRADFRALYDALSNQGFVDKLEQTAGVTLANKAQLVNDLDTMAKTRSQVLREVVESNEVKARMYNDAFVLMEYFGYLRRDAEAAGFQAWLTYLNAHPGDYRTMVNGFVNSIEYRKRFGRP